MFIGILVTAAVYWPGLNGGWLFDDYPNIVDNHDVQPTTATVASLTNVALSSPSSEFKRPLASLSFALNYLATGLNPYWMKLTNLVIHLLNGWLAFLLAKRLLQASSLRYNTQQFDEKEITRVCIIAALVAGGWLLLPINLTGVLYVVQRMESMANVFVFLGLIGYVIGRQRMLATPIASSDGCVPSRHRKLFISSQCPGLVLCLLSVTLPTVIGVLAKETAALLPLYALLAEWSLFGFRRSMIASSRCDVGEHSSPSKDSAQIASSARDWRIFTLFLVVLALPMIMGLAWLIPGLLKVQAWATRDFTMTTRLLSEARIVVDYFVWTMFPTPHALSFYHDDFRISTSLLQPWTTLACILALAAMVVAIFALRKRRPLAALGLALFLGCQLLTATIIPLELIFEHRNYFASFGLMLAFIPLLVPFDHRTIGERRFTIARSVLLAGLLLLWTGQTFVTSIEWSNPVSLAESLAARRPTSPRAQYELGRTYIIYSKYDPDSPFTKLAYAPLERSAALPNSSILAEQALIFMNARMHLPAKDAWWDSLIGKLKAHKPSVQDESSLASLTQCVRDNLCDLPVNRMMQAFMAALSHPDPSARLLSNYGDYNWNVLGDRVLGLRLAKAAVEAAPSEPVYRITLVRMLIVLGDKGEIPLQMKALHSMNIGDRLGASIRALQQQIDTSNLLPSASSLP
ncbi:hypothetical protein [Dyella psychrodurans]|uniref:Tetratricopeptide repeat protein n=1 Tax=Dyella psychrodurans TaxID=1927960 RepID=A0A370XAJ0_9GAMM|nr:hypothetical protein [Dyella psychrodurans]RDS85302.1 hypothetical protein DWU99_07155 [Dyella psychrodurans]